MYLISRVLVTRWRYIVFPISTRSDLLQSIFVCNMISRSATIHAWYRVGNNVLTNKLFITSWTLVWIEIQLEFRTSMFYHLYLFWFKRNLVFILDVGQQDVRWKSYLITYFRNDWTDMLVYQCSLSNVNNVSLVMLCDWIQHASLVGRRLPRAAIAPPQGHSLPLTCTTIN